VWEIAVCLTSSVVIGIAIFVLVSVGLVLTGRALLRNERGWGVRYVERTTPRVFRMGTADTHRKILGTGYLVVGTIFTITGIALLVSLL
jgi:hypothetical protein